MCVCVRVHAATVAEGGGRAGVRTAGTRCAPPAPPDPPPASYNTASDQLNNALTSAFASFAGIDMGDYS